MVSLADVGLFVSLAFPLVISLYKETRFVTRKNILASGIALIVFSLSYTAYELPKAFNYLSYWHWIFLLLGLGMIYIYKNPERLIIEPGDEWTSLVFSWKNFGAFELAFLSPIFLTNSPPLPINIFGNSVLSLGVTLLAIFWLISIAILIYRNKWLQEG